ncbi:MAG TPA: tRNA (adenosine(37)-N6)-threonylcarbamoyltransferase complex ATPase subunit type 1 TsaE [Candidatus Dormibacteraeota bacterium]|nr:tRNA (adenosine(37)-N6)-threonylcarbamoyltransferase complex ATPase subunit type 1 TsaE [Candidatus Dormibacteraeota bacterium]
MATTTSRELVTVSAAETEAAAERLASHLHRGDLVLLVGDLGAGKTTFVRGLARGLGSPADVMSPTFQLVRIYPGRVQLAHVDLYRLADPGELDDLGLDELLEEGAAVVEWGERLDAPATARISFEVLADDRRRLRLEEAPPSWSW